MDEGFMREVQDTIWAIHPPALEAALARARQGEVLAAQPRQTATSGAVAIVPVVGVLTNKAPQGMFEILFGGGTSMEQLGATVRQLAADPAISAIILDIDSPGGSFGGTPEVGDAIFQSRGTKPIIAVANTLAASAAYWIASQADEIIISPSGQVGSIGIIQAHEDLTGMAEKLGIKPTLFTAGKYKAVGHALEPMTDETKAIVQRQVDAAYGMFVGAVARGRGVKAADVRGGFGEGWIVGAKEAVSLGMADRVGTLRETIARFAGRARAGPSAEAWLPTEAEIQGLAERAAASETADLELRERRMRLAGLGR